MPVVSARPMPLAPRSTSRATTDSSWASGTSPSNGAAEGAGDAGIDGLAAAMGHFAVALSLTSDSAMDMFTLARLWLSLADTTV
jgi:hypothetical protein